MTESSMPERVSTKKGAELQARAFEFSGRVVRLHRFIYKTEPDLRDLTRQLLRSATSIGANLEEADAAQSRADFISKCSIALKEARETNYWIRILSREVSFDALEMNELQQEAHALISILTTIVRRSRENMSIAESSEEYDTWT